MHFIKAVVLFAGVAAALPAVSEAPKASALAAASPSASKAAAAAASPSSSKAAAAAASPSSSKAAAAAASPSKAASVSSKPASSSAAPSKSASVAASKSASVAASASPVGSSKIPTSSQVAAIKADLTAFDTALKNVNDALTAFTGGTKIVDQAKNVSTYADTLQAKTVQLLSDANALSGYGQFATADSSAIVKLIVPSITTRLVTVYDAVKAKYSLYASDQLQATGKVHDGLIGIATEISQIGDALEPHLQSADVKTIQGVATNVYNSATGAIAKYS